jgi:hypothetical protein
MPEGKLRVMVYNVGHACQTGACGDENCECASFHNMKTSCPFAEDMPCPPAHDGCDCYMTPASPDPPRPEGQVRMTHEMVSVFQRADAIEFYNKPIALEDGTGTAIGIWKMEISSQVLDDPAISQLEVVVVAGKEL